MQADTDLTRRVEYRRDFPSLLSLSLVLLCLPLFLFAISSDVSGTLALAAWTCVGFGCAGVAWAAWRVFVPGRPLVALSADGIVWNSGVGKIAIPWAEVQDIQTESYTVTGWTLRGSFQKRFENSTMVLVSRAFYARHIDPGSDFMRGPYWHFFLRPKGDFVQIALHHESYGVGHRDVRGPIEARWLAFRDIAERPPSNRYEPIRFGGGLNFASPWRAAMVTVPLVLCLAIIGNIVGAWETPGQKNSRIQREGWAARDRQINQQINEQLERHRQSQERMWQRVEDSRMFRDGRSRTERGAEPAAGSTPP